MGKESAKGGFSLAPPPNSFFLKFRSPPPRFFEKKKNFKKIFWFFFFQTPLFPPRKRAPSPPPNFLIEKKIPKREKKKIFPKNFLKLKTRGPKNPLCFFSPKKKISAARPRPFAPTNCPPPFFLGKQKTIRFSRVLFFF